MKVLVIVDQREGKIKGSAHEVITAAYKLSGNAGDVAALVIGKDVDGIPEQLKGYGAAKVLVAKSDALHNYNALNYCAAADAAIKTFAPQIVLAAATPMGRDMLPRLAARHDGGILTDLTEIQWAGTHLVGKKPMYSAKAIAQVQTADAAPIHFASIRPNVIPAEQVGGDASAESLAVEIPAHTLVTKEVRKGKSEKADLTEAGIIISGGRSLGSADNFKILSECADVIGATVGASRAAVDSGYASHDMQVGQTGKTVNPSLYIACGISGSIQHMAGMRTSKVIVAVNTDPEAPIFGVASYGIVGDLFKVVPLLTAEFKKILN